MSVLDPILRYTSNTISPLEYTVNAFAPAKFLWDLTPYMVPVGAALGAISGFYRGISTEEPLDLGETIGNSLRDAGYQTLVGAGLGALVGGLYGAGSSLALGPLGVVLAPFTGLAGAVAGGFSGGIAGLSSGIAYGGTNVLFDYIGRGIRRVYQGIKGFFNRDNYQPAQQRTAGSLA